MSLDKIQLKVAARVLRSRLTRPTTIDVTILEHDLIEESNKLDEYCSRFLGCFSIRSDKSYCFYLIEQNLYHDTISHVYLFYLGDNYQVIQEEEVIILQRYIPSLFRPGNNIKIGIVNVISSSNKAANLSLLIESVDYSIGSQLVRKYEPLQTINTDIMDLKYGANPDKSLTYCDGGLSEASVKHFKSQSLLFSIKFDVYHEGAKTDDPGFGLLWTRGHFVGVMYCKVSRIVNYLICHDNQFKNEEHYEGVKSLASEWITSPIDDHMCTRLYPNKFTKCDSLMVLGAMAYCKLMQPSILTVIQENDLKGMHNVELDCIESLIGSLRRPRFESAPYVRVANTSQSSEAVETANSTQLIFSGSFRHPQLIEKIPDSQATIIVEPNEIKAELSFWREISNKRQKIRDSIVPPIHMIQPCCDLDNKYLEKLLDFELGVKFQAKIWNEYAKTIAFRRIDSSCDKGEISTEGYHFVIYPVSYLDAEESLLIVDQNKREWIYLQPDNRSKDPEYFTEIASSYLLGIFPELADYDGRFVPITNLFHKRFTRLHLLMALYVISRLFRYSIALPSKVIYGEWELRKYANNISSELQLVNSEYNLAHELVDEQGYLKEGAMESYPSSFTCEKSVIPRDQCMFCKRRNFNNLGSHYSMAHGGKAYAANDSRWNKAN